MGRGAGRERGPAGFQPGQHGRAFAGGVLVARLRQERDGVEEEAAERRAQRLVGLSFFLLAAYIALHSGASLVGWLPEPQPSLAGVGIVVASAVVMGGLYVAKMRIAARMQSRSLRAEAMESLFCDLQDMTILIGLGFNALFSWWWADPVSALFLIPFLVKEGRENFSGHEEHDEENEGHEGHENRGAPVCFCPGCFFGLRQCRAACCQA